MAEEKSAPKKEKARAESAERAPKKEAAPAAEVKTPAAEKPAREKAPKAAGEKVAGEKTAAPAAPAAPVEMVGGVAKQPTAEDLLKEELSAIKVRKAKGSKNVTSGVVNVLASFNNTIVSITDQKGQVIAWSSAGKCNFRGSRKSTAYAAQVVAQDAARNAMSHGLKDAVIRVSGPGLGRDSAIRALQSIGLEISSIVDVTPIPHNGCRPRKRRRV
ncbi:MAG: 30S ribosomal protein S11 [Opitutaceae bacterium]|jgi:small subunit ribosomal protein S11